MMVCLCGGFGDSALALASVEGALAGRGFVIAAAGQGGLLG